MTLWNHDYTSSQQPFIATVVIAAVTTVVAFIAAGFFFWRSFTPSTPSTTPSSSRRSHPRRWSMTSTTMGLGGFPPETKYPDPVIHACLILPQCPTIHDVLTQVVPHILEYRRMATIPLPHSRSDRPCVDLDRSKLVRHDEFQEDDQQNDICLYDKVKEYLHQPLSTGRGDLPWWEIVILENTGTGNSCVLWRVHHSLADGMSMVALIENFITHVDGSPMECLVPTGMNNKFKVKKPWYQFTIELIHSIIQVVTMPGSNYDHPTAFSKTSHKNMIHNQHRQLVRFVDTPIDFVKNMKTAANVTINDVLFTCLSQAIHEYLIREKCPVLKEQGTKLLCRSLMPIAFPQPTHLRMDKEQALRNKWCFVETDFFLGHDDIMDRLKLVHAQMMALKTSPLPLVQLTIQNILPTILPLSFNRKVVFDTISRRSVVFSNVPGPTKPCMFASKEVIGVQMFYSNLIAQTGFISYREQIFGNICLDPVGIQNCNSLSILYSQALVQLAERLNVTIPDIVAQHASQPIT